MTGPRKGLFQRGRQLEGFWRRGADRAIVVTSRRALARRFTMLRTRAFLRLLAPSTLVLGCATSKPFDRTTEPGGRPISHTTAGSVILTGEDLSANPGWTVLDAIRRAMPQVKISTGRGLNPCPLIELRGRDSVTGSSDPDVYVDGTRTVDTCPLVTLQAIEASRIEIYPLGVTSRPGYPSRGHGLPRLIRRSTRGYRPVNHNGVVRSVLLLKCCAATAASRFALFSTASLSEYGRRSGILVSTALGPGTSAGTPVRRTSVHPSMPCKNSDTHFWYAICVRPAAPVAYTTRG